MQGRDRFEASIFANLGYWRNRTRGLTVHNLTEIEADQQNLFRAIQFGLAVDATWREAAKVILQCFPLVFRGGYWRAWLPFLETAAALCGPDDLVLEDRLLEQLGILLRDMGRLERAHAINRREEEIAQALGDAQRIGITWFRRAEILRLQRDLDAAERLAQAALELLQREQAEPRNIAQVVAELGRINLWAGKFDAAAEDLSRAAHLFELEGDEAEQMTALQGKGIALQRAGRFRAALEAYQEAQALGAVQSDRVRQIELAHAVGVLHFFAGDLQAAAAAFEEANTPWLRHEGPLPMRAFNTLNRGNICLAQKELARAEALLRESVELWRLVEDPLWLSNTLGDLAKTLALAGRGDEARAVYIEAAELAERFPDDILARGWLEKFRAALEELEPDSPEAPGAGPP